jgi:hypothetical protein
MGKTYEKADNGIEEEVRAIIARFYPELKEAGITISLMIVEDRDNEGALKDEPALLLHGTPAAAIVKKNSLKDRAEGKADASIFIDGNRWNDWADGTRTAILHHEIHHLALVREGGLETGPVVLDALGRPCLFLRRHDFEVGWFHKIAEIYGDASLEVQQAKAFADEKGQLYFGWSVPPDHAVESAKTPRKPSPAKPPPPPPPPPVAFRD